MTLYRRFINRIRIENIDHSIIKLYRRKIMQFPTNYTPTSIDLYSLGIDPSMSAKAQQEIHKEMLKERIRKEMASNHEARRQRLQEERNRKLTDKKNQLQKMESARAQYTNDLQTFQTRFSDGLKDEEQWQSQQLEKVRQNGLKVMSNFQEKAKEKMRQLQEALEYQRKVIERINQQNLEEAQKSLKAKSRFSDKNKYKYKEDLGQKINHYALQVEKLKMQLSALGDEWSEVNMEKKIQVLEQEQVEKRLSEQLRRKQDNRDKYLCQGMMDRPLISNNYEEQYSKILKNSNRVYGEKQNMGYPNKYLPDYNGLRGLYRNS